MSIRCSPPAPCFSCLLLDHPQVLLMKSVQNRREPQIKPWLAYCHRQACTASANQGWRSAEMKTVRQRRICDSSRTPAGPQQGLDVRELVVASSRGRVFSLDIPFCRTRPWDYFPPSSSISSVWAWLQSSSAWLPFLLRDS